VVRYLPTTSNYDAKELANIFLIEIVYKTRAPTSIVTDRGSLFTSGYWTQFYQALHITGRLSTAYHPQTDGQTERQNQTLKAYLRTYANFQQDDWIKWLPLAKFAYNNAKHSSTSFSPFKAWQGTSPSIPGLKLVETLIINAAVEDQLSRLQEVRRQLKGNL
jgi:hypothetical protein